MRLNRLSSHWYQVAPVRLPKGVWLQGRQWRGCGEGESVWPPVLIVERGPVRDRAAMDERTFAWPTV